MKKQKLFYFELKPNMTVAQDIYSNDGRLLITSGSILTDSTIANLAAHSIFEVYVNIPDNTSADIPSAPISTASYSERIKSSPSFQTFQKEYIDNITEFQTQLNNIVTNNSEIDPDKFIASTVDLLNSGTSGFHIFDMLHNMREYDDSTHIHSVNVGLISAVIGKWLNYSTEDINTLILCGMLHDVGKLTIPLDILAKPGKLTEDEYDVIKQHPANGYNLLKHQNIDSRAKMSCLLHHERCDGSGYPLGLKGHKIPTFAKIISIADVYDAMTANRVYRQGICPFDVIKTFEKTGLCHFDPMIIMTFLKNIVQTYINNYVRLSDGTVGEIIMINPFDLSNPVINTAKGCIDLSKETDLKIEAIV